MNPPYVGMKKVIKIYLNFEKVHQNNPSGTEYALKLSKITKYCEKYAYIVVYIKNTAISGK